MRQKYFVFVLVVCVFHGVEFCASQLISSLLSSFGLILRGIYTGLDNTVDTVCPPQTKVSSASFDDCIKVLKCRYPEIGIYPNCFIPPCPPPYTGTYPKCKTQSNDSKCPIGSDGVFPMCEVQFPELQIDQVQPTEDYAQSGGHSSITTHQIPTQMSNEIPQFSSLPPAQSTQKEVEATSVFPGMDVSTEQLEVSQMPTTKNCGTGSHGKFPNCVVPSSAPRKNCPDGSKSKKCRSPCIGVYPDCFIPPCPPQYTGTYPKCIIPTERVCPKGSHGTFPNCIVTSTTSTRNCSNGSTCVRVPPSMHSSSVPPQTELPTGNKTMEWNDFKRKFNKTYDNRMEEEKRQQIFRHNLEIVEGHNKRFELGIETYSLSINQFSDRTSVELIGNGSKQNEEVETSDLE